MYGYDREKAVAYAHKWAYGRNPLFYNFTGIGGDCTNFISQCILAGCCTMNCRETFGWYYNSSYDRTPSWTGVQYLYDFLTANEGSGPWGRDADIDELQIGDIVQLGGADGRFTLYNDAGDGYGYERGEYATVTYEWHDDEERLDAAFSGDARFALDEPVVEIIK